MCEPKPAGDKTSPPKLCVAWGVNPYEACDIINTFGTESVYAKYRNAENDTFTIFFFNNQPDREWWDVIDEAIE